MQLRQAQAANALAHRERAAAERSAAQAIGLAQEETRKARAAQAAAERQAAQDIYEARQENQRQKHERSILEQVLRRRARNALGTATH
jgi:hypothetical protein